MNGVRVESFRTGRTAEGRQQHFFLAGQVCGKVSLQRKFPLFVSAASDRRASNDPLVVGIDPTCER